MRRRGIEARYRKPNTRQRHPRQPLLPSLLRGRSIARANQVWAMAITFLPMARGCLYRAGVLDWHRRGGRAPRLSIGMPADFCLEVLAAAVAPQGPPPIMNTDQGSQFTGAPFLGERHKHGASPSTGRAAGRGARTWSASGWGSA